jgi:hypothetical protein
MDKLFCGDEEEEAAKPQVKVGKLNRSLRLESLEMGMVKYQVKVRSLEMFSATIQAFPSNSFAPSQLDHIITHFPLQ